MPAYTSELAHVETADDLRTITNILSSIVHSEYGESPVKASLAVGYLRKSAETISDLDVDNSYRKDALDETFILTVELRVQKYDANFETLKPLIDETLTDLRKAKRIKAEKEREELIVRRAAIEAELTRLDDQLAK